MTKPNLGKQRTVGGAYSHDIGERDSKRLGDVPCGGSTVDRVRAGADHPDLGTYPGRTPNFYVSSDPFKAAIKLTHPDVDPDGSRALQKDWHRKAGFSQEVSRADNHPGKGTTNMKSRGTDTASPGQGSPAKAPFSWE